jgi:hypothetical protein
VRVRGYYGGYREGDTVTFIACAIVLSLPARNEDGTQDLKFMLCNIDGVVSTAIRKAIDAISTASITFRKYISTDLPRQRSRRTSCRLRGSWTPLTVNVTAGFKNMLDYAWPRDRYTLPYFRVFVTPDRFPCSTLINT